MTKTRRKRRGRKAVRQPAGWSLRAWLDDTLSLTPVLWAKAAGSKLRQARSRA
jgi:hypothetical protein